MERISSQDVCYVYTSSSSSYVKVLLDYCAGLVLDYCVGISVRLLC